MKSGYDISRIDGDGYLVIPLSMARLSAGQSPEETYEIFDYFAKKIASNTNDVIFLYTGGLYFNAEDVDFKKRVKINSQMISHAYALRRLIHKRKKYIPGAFHFLPIDYVILNSKYFKVFFDTLKRLEKKDKKFRKAIQKDMGDRPYIEPNINFILEEVVVAHIIKQRLVEFPRTLVRNDIWRLMAYPGKYMASEAYQWKKKILPQPDTLNPYNKCQYDFNKKKLYIFDQL